MKKIIFYFSPQNPDGFWRYRKTELERVKFLLTIGILFMLGWYVVIKAVAWLLTT